MFGKIRMAVFVFVSGCVFIGNSWSQTVPQAKERTVTIGQDDYLLRSRLKNLLHANFTFGFHHNDGKPVIQSTLEDLAADEGWNLANITNHSQITLDELQKYEAVVFNNVSGFNNGTFSNSSETAVQTYVEEGGGTFSIHGSGDGESNQWPWYTDVWHPVGYAGHGARSNADVFRGGDADGHPVMEGLFGDGIETAYGEWYKNFTAIYNNPNAEVLLEFDPSTCGGCIEQQYVHPEGNGISWVLNIGQGKNLYFPFGHDLAEKDEFNDPGKSGNWDNFIRQGLYYIAGYDTLKIGCMDENADNYDPEAEVDTDPSSCQTVRVGYNATPQDQINFHPNLPAVVFSSGGSHSVRLMDINGKTIDAQSLEGPVEYFFDKRTLRSGIYILQATANGKTRAKRYFLE